MIRSFRSRALKALWSKGDASKIPPALLSRLRVRLNTLHAAPAPEGMNIPGFNFHKLRGKPVRYTVHVNGPWCVTFGWQGEDAVEVDLEDYH
jgi:proteic killer suppression protein